MPLTAKGREILASLEKEYGPEKGKQVLYAGKNKGTFAGIDDSVRRHVDAICDSVKRLDARIDAYCDSVKADAQRMFPSYTLVELKKWVAEGTVTGDKLAKVQEEIANRESGASQQKVTPQASWGGPTKIGTKVGRM